MSRLISLALAAICLSTTLACSSGGSPTVPAMTDPVIAQAVRADADGATLLTGFRVDIDPDTLVATATPHRTGSAQPPQGQRYDLDIANFQNADSFRITGVQILLSGNFRVSFTHAHPFPAPNIANPATGTNRADLGYTGRLVLLTSYNPQSFFTNAVRLSAGAVVTPDGYVETGDLLAHAGPSLVTAYPYKLLADEALDNRVDRSNGGNPIGSYSPASGGWQRVNLGASGDGWTGYDYIHGGQTVANQFTLDKDALAATNFAIDVALLIQYTDPRGAGGATHRLPAAVLDVLDFAYRLPYAALDCSKVVITTNLTLGPKVSDAAALEVRVRDWDASAETTLDASVGDEADVALIQQDASGSPEVVLDAPGILAGLRNMGTATGTGLSNDPLLYANDIVNQEGATAGEYFGCLRITDPEYDDEARSLYHAGVDPDTLLPAAARAIPARTWQLVPITIGPAVPIITAVSPNGIVGAIDEPITFTPTVTGSPTAWDWDFGGGARIATSTVVAPSTFLAGLPGTFTGSVTATNAGGSSAPFEFTYRVLDPQRPDVAVHTIESTLYGLSVTEGQRLFVINDRPVLLYSHYFGGSGINLNCAVAQVPVPDEAADWAIHQAFQGDGGGVSATLINDRLAFVMNVGAPDSWLIAGFAEVDLPAASTDWTVGPVTPILAGSDFGRTNRLMAAGGRAVVACSLEPADHLYICTAEVALPTSTADWTRYVISSDFTCFDLATLLLPEGERAALYYGDATVGETYLQIATAAAPLSVVDWTGGLLEDLGAASLSITRGRVFADQCELFTAAVVNPNGDIRLVRHRAFPGGGTNQVAAMTIGTPASNLVDAPVLVRLHNDRPLVYYRSADARHMLIRALRPEPLSTDWALQELPFISWTERVTIASVDNRIAIAGAENRVFFGVASTPW